MTTALVPCAAKLRAWPPVMVLLAMCAPSAPRTVSGAATAGDHHYFDGTRLELSGGAEAAMGYGPALAAPVSFDAEIGPIAKKQCDPCHASQETGPMSQYATARKYVVVGKPEESPFYFRGLGQGHPAAWGDTSQAVRAWIEAGAAR